MFFIIKIEIKINLRKGVSQPIEINTVNVDYTTQLGNDNSHSLNVRLRISGH